MMPGTIPVFVNERRVLLPQGGTAAMAVAADPALGEAQAGAALVITDARGLPVPLETVLAPGAILRVAASARRAGGGDADA